jgi:hypothetical protein
MTANCVFNRTRWNIGAIFFLYVPPPLKRRWKTKIRLAAFFLLVVPLLSFANAAEKEAAFKLPVDVASFKERRDACDHFRGEESYDQERRKFLVESLEKYCTGTDRELAALKAKYKSNKTVIDVLREYEEKIEANSI